MTTQEDFYKELISQISKNLAGLQFSSPFKFEVDYFQGEFIHTTIVEGFVEIEEKFISFDPRESGPAVSISIDSVSVLLDEDSIYETVLTETGEEELTPVYTFDFEDCKKLEKQFSHA